MGGTALAKLRRAGRQGKSLGVHLIILASIMVATAACSNGGPFDRRISSPDVNFVSELAGELDAAGIDFRALRDGSIAYRSKDEEAFRSIEARLTKDPAAGTYAKFDSDEQRKAFLALLDAGKKRYHVELRPEGEWIRWFPSSEEEARAMTARELENAAAAPAAAKK